MPELTEKASERPNPRPFAEAWAERCARKHAEAVARGEHDAECEYLAEPGFYLCHCSKRRREAAGHTAPPEDLEFPPPVCPRCYHDVEHDGESWTCSRCCCCWQEDGTNAEFTDNYGDLAADLAEFRARRRAHEEARRGRV